MAVQAGQALPPDALFHAADPGQVAFESTADLEGTLEVPGQERAMEAIQYAAGMRLHGHNAFVLGPSGSGRHAFVRHFLAKRAVLGATPSDWCYVDNFRDARQPKALALPPGIGTELKDDIAQVIQDAQSAIPVAFESEEFQNQRESIDEEFKEFQEIAFGELEAEAKKRDIGIVQTPTGFAFVPLEDGEAMRPDAFEKLTEDDQSRYQAHLEELTKRLNRITRSIPKQARDMRRKLRELEREITTVTVSSLFEDLLAKYRDYAVVVEHLGAMQADIVDNAQLFLAGAEPPGRHRKLPTSTRPNEAAVMRRYSVNVLVDSSRNHGAPVIFEDQPSFSQLIGKIEHEAQFGALITDFSLIRAGALHCANGGYLVVDAAKVLSYPAAWEGLKLAIKSGEVRMRSLGDDLGFTSTVTLEPEPIPLDIKVILIGERLHYYLLSALDPEFQNLFKVAADFEDQIHRSPDNVEASAQYFAALIREEGLRNLSKSGFLRLTEASARLAGDGERLSGNMRQTTDLLREAHYWAERAGHELIQAEHVERAIAMRRRRSSRHRDRLLEETLRDTLVVETSGKRVGQINGLSVLMLGDYGFGRPQRISASVSLGAGKVIDIEREVELGGPLHSKGVLILSGFLGSHYVTDRPLSLSASLVFEQSYGGVDGDSASAAELCALLSALAEVPITQSLAITGSVDQHGQVQAIGGVNEKIEGFFDICNARGLTGEQGVLIPVANVKHLMLNSEVIKAVERGQFHVYPVDTIDRCVELLAGMPAGETDEDGEFPTGSFNAAVRRRLIELAAQRRAFGASGDKAGGGSSG